MPAAFETLAFDIMCEKSVRMFQSGEFQASLGTLNTLDSPVCFLPSNT